jgi:hypothetical protein
MFRFLHGGFENKTLYLGSEGMAQVVKCLLSKCNA